MNRLRCAAAAALAWAWLPLYIHAQPAHEEAPPSDPRAAFDTTDTLFHAFARDHHVPGLVYGIVAGGELVHVRAMGVQDTVTKAPVTADTVFRIASMSKSFTALAVLRLRDQGKLALDDPADRHIPELASLRYPTADSPRITVRDLLTHASGFVTDDPWADRFLDMPDEQFSRFVAAGVPFSRTPGTAYEYSNFGYALLGRLVSNVSGRPYADEIAAALLAPLGMRSTTFDVARVPRERLALGYRWESERWKEEPLLAHGAFGAMGGLMTTANDFARYVAWVLDAWPPRDEAEDGIVKRAARRELARGQTFATAMPAVDPGACGRAASYSFGNVPYSDCVLGLHFGHSGGLPGYGSNVLMLPERGLGVFAFANRTYAPASAVVREAAGRLVQSGAFPVRAHPASAALQGMAAVVARIYAAGDVLAARDALAVNVLLDRDASLRNAQIAALKEALGACGAAAPIQTTSAMGATVTFPCERGTLRARILLAPTTPASLQTLEFTP